MTPKAAAQLMNGQLVINTKTQEIGTVRSVQRGDWCVAIDWCETGLLYHPFYACDYIKRY